MPFEVGVEKSLMIDIQNIALDDSEYFAVY